MKKSLILLTLIGGLYSCKKDRVCSCKQVTDVYDNTTGVKTATNIVDQDYTMTEVGYKTAFNACVHTKNTDIYGNTRLETDMNCELK
jgi:hypothetical protein